MKKYFSNIIQDIKNDFSLSAFFAGVIVIVVGVSSSGILVYQAAISAGATVAEASSWLGSLCLAMGITGLILSYRFKTPVLLAWSTAGAALLTVSLKNFSIHEAIGSFIFSAALIFLIGISGFSERIINKIPIPIAAALLAGVLFHFSIDAFLTINNQPLLALSMIVAYILGRKFSPRFAMIFVLLIGICLSVYLNLLKAEEIHFSLTQLTFNTPALSLQSLLSIGLPLFIVTMASQNLTGLASLRAHNYNVPISPLLTWSGFANLIAAPFGGFTVNLAAVTAAIGMGPESHPDPNKRYIAGMVSGFFYILIGGMAGTIATLFAAFPKELISVVVGLALISTIANALKQSLQSDEFREAAFITFLVTASGVSFFGVGSSFWGIIAGIIVHNLMIYKLKR
jgi:benzoate membrane transport protein